MLFDTGDLQTCKTVINNLLDRETAFSERSWDNYIQALSSSRSQASGQSKEARTKDCRGLLLSMGSQLLRNSCKTRISYCRGRDRGVRKLMFKSVAML